MVSALRIRRDGHLHACSSAHACWALWLVSPPLQGSVISGLSCRELRALLARLGAALSTASQHLPVESSSGQLPPDQAVRLCAALDAMYYVLLERHLSSRGRTPAVPPPHVYFTAVAAAHPGVIGSQPQLPLWVTSYSPDSHPDPVAIMNLASSVSG